MPQYNRAELGRMATETGFVRDTFEKVLRLKEILKFLNEDEFLREHLLLKGGTAINLTVFNLPRLSVDIDMDYTPNDTREDMLECRTKITEAIKDYMEAEGYQLSEGSRWKDYNKVTNEKFAMCLLKTKCLMIFYERERVAKTSSDKQIDVVCLMLY